MCKWIFLTIILCIEFISQSQERNLPYTTWNKDFPELEYQTIFDISQDEIGRIWIGTNIGLYYYTGYETKKINFQEFNKSLSSNQKVICILSEGDFIYCTTTHAIYKLNIYDLSSQIYVFKDKQMEGPKIYDDKIAFKTFTLNLNLKKVAHHSTSKKNARTTILGSCSLVRKIMSIVLFRRVKQYII